MVAIWTLIRWYNGRIVFRSQFETFPIHFVCSKHFIQCTGVQVYRCTSYLLWPRQHVYRHAAHSRSSGPAPSSREGKEQHWRGNVISSEITVIATRRVPGCLDIKYFLIQCIFMPFFPEWSVPPKILFAIYVRFGINQTLIFFNLIFLSLKLLFLNLKKKNNKKKKIAFSLIRNNKIS